MSGRWGWTWHADALPNTWPRPRQASLRCFTQQHSPCHAPAWRRQVNQRYVGGCSKGELTLVGQEQAREFGRWLRWRYHMVHGLLPERHEPGVVNARTTNYSRTVATLQARRGCRC